MIDAGLSRDEIEVLCLLVGVRAGDCTAGELAARLGLSSSLARVVAECVSPLVGRGWLEIVDNKLRLATSGRELLAARLSRLGIS